MFVRLKESIWEIEGTKGVRRTMLVCVNFVLQQCRNKGVARTKSTSGDLIELLERYVKNQCD